MDVRFAEWLVTRFSPPKTSSPTFLTCKSRYSTSRLNLNKSSMVDSDEVGDTRQVEALLVSSGRK